MVATNTNPMAHRIRGNGSVLARKKKNGKVMFKARPRSLLSASIEPGGPYNRNEPPVNIMNGTALTTRNPKHADITKASQRNRYQLFTIPIVAKVIRRIFETTPQRYQV